MKFEDTMLYNLGYRVYKSNGEEIELVKTTGYSKGKDEHHIRIFLRGEKDDFCIWSFNTINGTTYNMPNEYKISIFNAVLYNALHEFLIEYLHKDIGKSTVHITNNAHMNIINLSKHRGN